MPGHDPCQMLRELLATMHALRAPGGCPWDAGQTPESLGPIILEEACEAIEAIESGCVTAVADELGDLLLQVVFQAQIFSERGLFDFCDVSTCIAEKLLRRHPHEFARESQEFPATDLDKQWEKIKTSEATHNKSCLADHLPGKLPALQRAQKLIAKTYKAERERELPDYDEISVTIQMLAAHGDDIALDEEALGMIFLHFVRMSHDGGLDAETALRISKRRLLQDLDNR